MKRNSVTVLTVATLAACAASAEPVRVGSKQFTESVNLGEVLVHLLRDQGFDAVHDERLGGTGIVFSALESGEIDAYVDYTGTLLEEVFATEEFTSIDQVSEALSARGIEMSLPIGFNNTYALAMKKENARKRGVETISDLRDHPELKFGLGSEFIEREDGWRPLKQRYSLPQEATGMNHQLSYRALQSGSVDVIDVYSTDASISRYNLKILKDDLKFFPVYNAVVVYRADLPKGVVDTLLKLEGSIDEEAMIAMNVRADVDKVSESQAAAEFVESKFGVQSEVADSTLVGRFLINTRDHFVLVAISMAMAIGVGLPLGVLAAKQSRCTQPILSVVGVIQTIPSLAILVFMIPLLGLHEMPAIAALFLYSLLPIVRNTYLGLTGIATQYRESAIALGLEPAARLRLIELPLALPSILAGVKTSAVINVGTATLGALIGAGGYGQPIFTGVLRDDVPLILEGAIPAAVMAVAIQWLFDLAERRLVPKGLRMHA